MIRIARGYRLADPADAAMFEDRRRLFVDLMRWDVPVVAGRYEIDRFDGPRAVYIAETDQAGGHRGSMRLLSSLGPHILGDLFPELCDGAVPQGPDIREITRLCLPLRLGAPERLAVRNRLISAMVDHALETGIAAFTGVVRPTFREAVLAMGWEAGPLGAVRECGGMALGAFRIAIDSDTPARLARTGIYAPAALPVAAAA